MLISSDEFYFSKAIVNEPMVLKFLDKQMVYTTYPLMRITTVILHKQDNSYLRDTWLHIARRRVDLPIIKDVLSNLICR